MPECPPFVLFHCIEAERQPCPRFDKGVQGLNATAGNRPLKLPSQSNGVHCCKQASHQLVHELAGMRSSSHAPTRTSLSRSSAQLLCATSSKRPWLNATCVCLLVVSLLTYDGSMVSSQTVQRPSGGAFSRSRLSLRWSSSTDHTGERGRGSVSIESG